MPDPKQILTWMRLGVLFVGVLILIVVCFLPGLTAGTRFNLLLVSLFDFCTIGFSWWWPRFSARSRNTPKE
jgi:TctA family transporter